MHPARVFRSIERPSQVFGLDPFDACLWCCSWVLLKWFFLGALVGIACAWLALFALHYKKAPRFLLHFTGYWLGKLRSQQFYDASFREAPHKPWLNIRRLP